MIQPGTNLKVADNTGAKIVRCIRILKGSKHRYARIGDIIVGSVKEAEPRRTVKKKEVVRAVIIRQKKPYRLPNGFYLRFDDNAVVIISNDGMPKGTRVFGPIARELRGRGYQKIISQAPEVL